MKASRLLFCPIVLAAACSGSSPGTAPGGGSGGSGSGSGTASSRFQAGFDAAGVPPPAATCTLPAQLVDTSTPTTVVGTGTAASCTEAALDAAVAKGGS